MMTHEDFAPTFLAYPLQHPYKVQSDLRLKIARLVVYSWNEREFWPDTSWQEPWMDSPADYLLWLLMAEIADGVNGDLVVRQKNAKIAELGRELSQLKRKK